VVVSTTPVAGEAHHLEVQRVETAQEMHDAVLGRADGADIVGALSASELVASEMARLAGLVEEFLQFARPQPLRRVRTEVRALAAGVIELLSEEASEAGVELVLEPGLDLQAFFDPERLRQVLLNLVRNAMEAAGQGGHVRLRVTDEGARVGLEVSDDGPGLSDPDAPIFEPFFTTKPDGTGLGLSIVHRIVTDHGGEVSVTSRPGATCFRVTLPLAASLAGQEI
jgi:signal transduction histidine kinase